MQLDQMQLALPSRDYYLKKNSEVELIAYQNYMTNVAVLLGADSNLVADEFNRVIILEKQFANVCFIHTIQFSICIRDSFFICGYL